MSDPTRPQRPPRPADEPAPQSAQALARAIQQELLGHEHTSMLGGSGCYPCGILTDDFAGHETEAIARLIHARDAADPRHR